MLFRSHYDDYDDYDELWSFDLAVSNRYDHLDRRVQKITPAATHTYFYDGWMLIKETVANTNGTTDVMDEATANYDKQSDAMFNDFIMNNHDFDFYIIVSHRKEILSYADKVINIE